MTRFFVGTAGWSYLKWDKEFYSKGTKDAGKLAYYASRFNAVELNNSFYRVPPAEQFTVWEAQVPAHFRFAVKAPRTITHSKKLLDPGATLPPFMGALKLQQKEGPVFFQLPPGFALNLERLQVFLEQLPKDRRYAVELRHPSWHVAPVYRLLARHKVAFCLFDTPEGISPREVTADFIYARLRGREGPHLKTFLKEWHAWLLHQTKLAYAIFDNREEKRLAFGNALAFRELTNEDGLA